MIAPRDGDEPAESEWVRALKRREPRAWERLQQQAVDPVFGYLFLRCGRREEAEDLTAEVFAAAVASIHAFRGQARVVTWLIGIARRKLIDSERKRRRRREVLAIDLPDGCSEAPADVDQDPQAALERRELLGRVRRLVLELPESQREALWLRCVDELSLAEIARVLRRSEDAVKGLLRRAKLSVLDQLKHGDTENAETEMKGFGLEVVG